MFDWFTFTAQIFNFLILVWLLKRFLYSPISKAMDKREKDIKQLSEKSKSELKNIELLKKELEKENESIAILKNEKLQELEDEIETHRKHSLRRVNEEVKDLELSYKNTLDREKKRLHNEFRKTIQNEILAIVRKILNDISNQNLESQIIEKFIDEFNNNGKNDSIKANQNQKSEVFVNSSFDLKEEYKKGINDLIHKSFGENLEIEYKTNKKTIAGIEVIIDGKKAAWTIEEYLSNLDRTFLQES